MFEFVPTTQAHIDSISSHIRQADIDEIWAVAMKTPKEAMEFGLSISAEVWTWTCDGEPLAVFGVAPGGLLSGVWHPWMIASDAIEGHLYRFVKGCRSVMPYIANSYGTLYNYVDARNTKAITWLRWMGFTVFPAEPYGVLGLPFHRFEFVR